MQSRFSCRNREKNSYSLPRIEQSSLPEEIRYSIVLQGLRSTMTFFKESRTCLNHQTNRRMTSKPEIVFGVFLEIIFFVITLIKEYVPVFLKIVRRTVRHWMYCAKVEKTIIGTSMATGSCRDRGKALPSSQYWIKNLQMETRFLEGEWQKFKPQPSPIIYGVQNKDFAANGKEFTEVSHQNWQFTGNWQSLRRLIMYHCTSTPHRSETKGTAERSVRRVKEGTSAILLQSSLD